MVLYHIFERCDDVFVVLRIITSEKSIVKRRKQKKAIAKSAAKSYSTDKGLPFFVLDVLNEKHGVDWDRVAEKCGRYASRIIAPRDFPLPDHTKLRRFIPLSMNSLLIFNTALETIRNAGLPPEGISITLTDRNAVHCDRIGLLLPFAACIRIITSQPERYAAACEKAYEDCGASLIIRSYYEPSVKPDIVICADGAISSSMKDAAIFTSRRKTGGKLRICGSGTLVAEHHKELVAQGIDPVDFCGAITELCGSPEYRNSVFEKLDISCNSCADSSPKKCLECFCSGSLPIN